MLLAGAVQAARRGHQAHADPGEHSAGCGYGNMPRRGGGPVCAPLVSAAVTGLASGDIGQALKAGAIAAATAAVFNVVGDLTGGFAGTLDPILKGHGPLAFLSDAHLFNIASHAAVGCGSAVASGGKCGPGALSGAVGSFATPLAESAGFAGGLAITTTAGGLASVAGGGKFGNGAVTAAFGYLYNGWLGRRIGGRVGAAAGAGACAPTLAGAAVCGGGGYIIGGEIGSDIEDWLTGTLWSQSSSISSAAGTSVHGNSATSTRPTEVYHLISNTTGDIDKIGITSNSAGRYSQNYLDSEGVTYVPRAQYQSRYPAMVH